MAATEKHVHTTTFAPPPYPPSEDTAGASSSASASASASSPTPATPSSQSPAPAQLQRVAPAPAHAHAPACLLPTASKADIARVKSAASQNSEILETLRKTSDAPSQLQAAAATLDAQQAALDAHRARLRTHVAETDALDAQRRRYASPLLRAAAKPLWLSASLEKRGSAKAAAHAGAVAARADAEKRVAAAEAAVADATLTRDAVYPAAEQHGGAHEALEALYARVFSTRGAFPAEEKARDADAAARQTLATAKERYAAQRFAYDALLARQRGGYPGADVAVAEGKRWRGALALGVRRAAAAVEETRLALELERQRVFEAVVGFGAAPPSYLACCIRTDGINEQEESDGEGEVEGQSESEGQEEGEGEGVGAPRYEEEEQQQQQQQHQHGEQAAAHGQQGEAMLL